MIASLFCKHLRGGFLTVFILLLAILSGAALADPLNLTGIQLRKSHGAAGVVAIDVDRSQSIAGNVTVESRAIGMVQEVVFQFDSALMLTGTVTVTDETGAAIGMSNALIEGSNVVVSIYGIPDNRRITVRLTNVNNSGVDVAAQLGFLVGDVNNSRSVNNADATAIKARAGQAVAAGNAVFDLNVSGFITAADIAAAKARSSRQLVSAYTLGGTVTGLSGTLVLQNNGAGDLRVSTNGSFTFPAAVGGGYSVSIAAQPAAQQCAVTNGMGMIGSASVSNVTVTCTSVQATSIYLIKTGSFANGALVGIDNALVTGIKNGVGYFLQVKPGDTGYVGDINSGIFVSSPTGTPMMAVGNRINLIATLDSSGGGFQLIALAATLTSGTAEALPTPSVVAGAAVATGGMQAAQFEGVLVTVANVAVTGTDAPNGEFTVSGGLVVDDFFYALAPLPANGTAYLSITGILRNVNGVNKLFPRSAADFVVAQAFSNAIVTYVKPLVPGASLANDPAGFFVQSSPMGPALFVAVDPAIIMPPPSKGDSVSFVVSSEAVSNGLRQAASIDLYAQTSTNNPLAPLVRDISMASDVVSAIDSYQSMLVRVTGTISSVFSSSGSGYQHAPLATAGLPTGLELRLPTALVSAMSLAGGCTVTLDMVPMWRAGATPQVSAWIAGDFTAVTCPAPRLLSATATSGTTLRLQFDRNMSAASVSGSGSQFTIDNGLSVSAASTTGTTVNLVTSAQTPAANYTVTVDSSVTDALGAPVDAMSRSAAFTGFGAPPSLIINEVDYDNVGTIDAAEFIELYNATGSTVDLSNLSVFLVNGSNSTSYTTISLAPAMSLAPGQYLVIGAASLQASLPPATKFIAFGLAQDNMQNGAPDGIALVNTATATLIDSLSYEGSITSATLSGVPGTFNLVRGTPLSALIADSNTVNGALCRFPNGIRTNNDAMDWTFCNTPTPGAPNIP